MLLPETSGIAGRRQDGTTEHSSDAWFIGYTPKLTTALWMGYAKGSGPDGQFPGLQERAGRDHPGAALAQLHGVRPGLRAPVHGTFPTVYSLTGVRR